MKLYITVNLLILIDKDNVIWFPTRLQTRFGLIINDILESHNPFGIWTKASSLYRHAWRRARFLDYGIWAIRTRMAERWWGGRDEGKSRRLGNGWEWLGRGQDGGAKTFAVSRKKPTEVLRRNYVNRNRQTPGTTGTRGVPKCPNPRFEPTTSSTLTAVHHRIRDVREPSA